jgi:hypothetical protein
MPKKSAAPPIGEPLDIADVRVRLGGVWGLDRDVTKRELARALHLSPKYGDEHVAKMENHKTAISGPIDVALRMMLAGAKPPTMADVIKPGYPRGVVRR